MELFSCTKCQSIIFSHWFQFMYLKESVLREWYFSVILTKKYHRSIMEVSSDHVAIAFLSCGFVLWMFWAHSGQYPCPLGATCLPNKGKVLAPLGHAACPFREELYRTAMSLVISKHYAGMNKNKRCRHKNFCHAPITPQTFIIPFWLKAMTLIRMKDFQ